MTKAELIDKLNTYVGRLEDGEIFDDIEMDDDIDACDSLTTITALIS